MHHDFAAQNQVKSIGLDASLVEDGIVIDVPMRLKQPLSFDELVFIILLLLLLFFLLLNNLWLCLSILWLDQEYLLDLSDLILLDISRDRRRSSCRNLDRCVRIQISLDVKHVGVGHELLEDVRAQPVPEERRHVVREELLDSLQLVLHQLVFRLLVDKEG